MNKIILFILLICFLFVNTSSATIVNLTATDDTYVKGSETSTNYGTESTVSTKQIMDDYYNRQIFIKFDLSGISNIDDATLYVYFNDTQGHDNITIYDVANQTWDELELTWDNKPVYNTTIGNIVLDGIGEWYSIDITDTTRYYTELNYTVHIRSATGANYVQWFSSKEVSGEGAYISVNYSIQLPTFTYTSANTTSYENEVDIFTANSSQTVNVSWLVNGAELQTNTSVTTFSYFNSTALNGTAHNITAIISNNNGSAQYSWSQLKLLNSFDMYVINETQTLVWFETSNYTAGLQGFNFIWENRIGTTGNTSTLYYQNGTSIISNSTYVGGNVTLIPGFIPEGTYYIEETATTMIETFVVAAGAFAAVVIAGAAVVSRRVRRGISGFWNRRIRRR